MSKSLLLLRLLHSTACSVDAHVNALKSGFDKADIILTTGGTSMGPTDLLKRKHLISFLFWPTIRQFLAVIERQLNGTIHFGRVAMKPGKPTTFASVPIGDTTKPIFALPGNPASALVTFYVFVLPALRKLGGYKLENCHLPKVKVKVIANL
jgi:gephyrin